MDAEAYQPKTGARLVYQARGCKLPGNMLCTLFTYDPVSLLPCLVNSSYEYVDDTCTHVASILVRIACQAPAVFRPMSVVAVEGEGDCLFHALAYFDNLNGWALRMTVAHFMDARADSQAGVEAEWHCAAHQLRAQAWGSAFAIMGYSLMTITRVMVHTLTDEAGVASAVEEVSHPVVRRKKEARMVHILHRTNMSHYDALVEVAPDKSGPPASRTEAPLVEVSSLFAPVAAYTRAYIASRTTSAENDETAVTEVEKQELLRLAGWLLQLLCVPQQETLQLRTALRTRQTMLRQHFGGRLLPWPWSFVIYGMIL